MSEHGTDLRMRVEGMACAGCAEAVRRTILRLDPQARVEVDLDGGRVCGRTRAPEPEVAGALAKAGYAATAATG